MTGFKLRPSFLIAHASLRTLKEINIVIGRFVKWPSVERESVTVLERESSPTAKIRPVIQGSWDEGA